MCRFLTIAVSGKSVPEVPEEFRRTINFAEQSNPSVIEHSPPDWISFTVTSGGCSCNLYRALATAPDDRSKIEKKYRKKGWSNAKIQRAIESHELEPSRSAGLRVDALDLVENLANAFGEIRLSLRWYSGDVGTENFALKDAGCMSLKDFRLDTTALSDETTILIKGKRMKTEPNQAMQRTSASVTDRAPSSTLRASHSRL